ncbi:hypothetical protein [Nonomuraea sp. KM90]|uniref:hypothetical protein n=1 Tax=Nonomuraea sp. KM90 TaxID=3457428 RepID=UPI003FCE3733
MSDWCASDGAAMTGTSGEEADGDALKEALRAYDEAHADLTGENVITPASADVSEVEEDGADGDADGDAGGVLSILTRTDYLVDDFDEIIAAGRRAYRSIEPDAGEDEAHDRSRG